MKPITLFTASALTLYGNVLKLFFCIVFIFHLITNIYGYKHIIDDKETGLYESVNQQLLPQPVTQREREREERLLWVWPCVAPGGRLRFCGIFVLVLTLAPGLNTQGMF